MGLGLKIGIRGIQEAQAAMLRAVAALDPQGAFGQAVVWATTQLHRYATYITHVQTGALRASHRMRFNFDSVSARGEIYIDPGSVNPLGAKPATYGVTEHGRGGSHAFYQRTYEEHGGQIGGRAALYITARM